ncbi:GrpB family protein [Paenibacillus piri]|uniref:GrpB family protein n=1 Tax=Paenibacillus piri TaxID=2547395 RepID=A0A4R5KIE9_9BACL|nr:GrpB family protein [Paenibacillus piri]TDF95166.1 GrpB family protein [Paenibacillus piri]
MELNEEISITNHNPIWKQWYLNESKIIQEVFTADLMEIQHIGSTAIPEIHAKPIVDLLVGLKTYHVSEEQNEQLVKLGYEGFGEAGVPGRLYYRKRSTESFNLAVCEWNSEVWSNNLIFRDYLISHPEEAAAYSLLKQDILSQGIHTLLGYSERKAAFILEMILKATQWKEEKKI